MIFLSIKFRTKNLIIIIMPFVLRQSIMHFRCHILLLFYFLGSILGVEVRFHASAAHLDCIFTHVLLLDIFVQGVFLQMFSFDFNIVVIVFVKLHAEFLLTLGIPGKFSLLVVLRFLFSVVIVPFFAGQDSVVILVFHGIEWPVVYVQFVGIGQLGGHVFVFHFFHNSVNFDLGRLRDANVIFYWFV